MLAVSQYFPRESGGKPYLYALAMIECVFNGSLSPDVCQSQIGLHGRPPHLVPANSPKAEPSAAIIGDRQVRRKEVKDAETNEGGSRGHSLTS